MAAKAKYTIRKSGEDDKYSWALFRNGFVICNGTDKHEAVWRIKVDKLAAQEAKEKANAKS